MIEWLAGILVGFMIHEGAHIAVADMNGGNITYNQNIEWTYIGLNQKSVAIAGLAAQAITSEILLRRDYQTNFTKGWLTYNVGNTLSYALQNELRGGYRDLANFTQEEARGIEAVMLVHSYTVAKRLEWKFFPTRNGIQIVVDL